MRRVYRVLQGDRGLHRIFGGCVITICGYTRSVYLIYEVVYALCSLDA